MINKVLDFFKTDIPEDMPKDTNTPEVIKPAECVHKWELVAKTYAPPIRPIANANIDPGILQKALFGVTSYMWQCSHCGIARKEEMLGSDENRLEDILDKIDKTGQVQYLKERSKTYAITQWVDTPTNLIDTNVGSK